MRIITDETLMETYERLRPIVLKAYKKIKIRLWQFDDYRQEALIVLYNMMVDGYEEATLPVHFKVKFNQHLLNALRREKAVKRGYDSSNYMDVTAFEYRVADSKGSIDGTLLYEDTKAAFMNTLKPRYRHVLLDLLDGKTVDRILKFRLKERLIRFLLEDDDKDKKA